MRMLLATTVYCATVGTMIEFAHGQTDPDTTFADLETFATEGTNLEPQDDFARPEILNWTTSLRRPFELRSGFHRSDSTSFLGPPVAIRSRLTLQTGNRFLAQLTIDHDAGEPFGPIRSPVDFAAGSITVKDLGPVRAAVIGDIRPRLGLGLTAWVGQRTQRLGNAAAASVRPRSSVQANTSADESIRYLGGGVDLAIGAYVRITAFVARIRRDATLGEDGFATSLPVTGFHRNGRERSQKGRMRGSVVGVTAEVDASWLALGLTTVAANTEVPLPPPSRAYQYHRFSGSSWRTSSVFWQIGCCKGFIVSGEAAIDDNRSSAGLIQARVRLDAGVYLFAAWRDYPPSFNSPLGSPPGATSSGANERGFIVGARLRSRYGVVKIERDVYRRPWLQATVNSPAAIDCWRLEANRTTDKARITLRFDVDRQNAFASHPVRIVRGRLRVRLVLTLNEHLRATLDFVSVRLREESTSVGQLQGHSITWRPVKRLLVTTGIALFANDSGKSSVYLFEPDIPGNFTISSLTGKGERGFAMGELQLSRRVAVWVKYAVTRFPNDRTVGSGVDAVTTSHPQQLSGAARFQI